MKCKLLVAEDELIERKVLCKTLQKYLGDLISLYEAKNGREAMELFAREAPQVAVLDIEMPGFTGLEVARKIRETDKNCAILFLTGFEQWQCTQSTVPAMGFNGIAAAFLGGLHPIGSIFSSYFIQHITNGGAYVDKTMYCAQISDLISSIIIYLCSFGFFFKYVLNKWLDRREERQNKKAQAAAEKGGQAE